MARTKLLLTTSHVALMFTALIITIAALEARAPFCPIPSPSYLSKAHILGSQDASHMDTEAEEERVP